MEPINVDKKEMILPTVYASSLSLNLDFIFHDRYVF
jgi:hypothetical protein